MANILLITDNLSSNTLQAHLEASHTVEVRPSTNTSDFPTGFDLIIVQRNSNSNTDNTAGVKAHWEAGKPILSDLNTSGAGNPVDAFGIGSSRTQRSTASLALSSTAHPVTGAYAGTTATVTTSSAFLYRRNTIVGAGLGATNPGEVIAVEAGTALLGSATSPVTGGVAPSRAVALGWLYHPFDISADGMAIIDQAIAWLLDAVVPPTPTVAATLTATPAGSLDATAVQPVTATLAATPSGSLAGVGLQAVTATLTVTPSGSLAGVDVAPGAQNIAATLTATPSGSLAATARQSLSATLTITPSGSLSALSDGDLAATLTVTPSGSLSGVEGAAWYVSADLTVTPTGSLSGEVQASVSASLTVTPSGSLWASRSHAHDPATGRGAFRLVASHRDGTRLAELAHAQLTGAITDSLNAVDGSGSGFTFNLPKIQVPFLHKPHPSLAHCKQFGEVQVYRGGHLLGTRVLIRPKDVGTEGSVAWQAVGLGWYFTKRRIGPAVRPNLLLNPSFEDGMAAWKPGYREGSIPSSPPKASIVSDPVVTGANALRVEGSTQVQVTVTRLGSDTTFARGSYFLTTSGKDALRAFADEVVVDSDPDDLEDIAPPVITIEGHTDSEPFTSHPGGNQWLSEQRAKAVYDYLAPLLPDGATVTWVGYGATRPIATNSTSDGRAANRRVDIKYPKMVSARGHRQYVQQVVRYTNPSLHLKRNLTFVAWGMLESYKEPNFDGSVVWIGRRPVGGDDASWIETDSVDVDAETPLGTESRWESTITVPADGQEWEIVVRLTPPAGTVVYDTTGLWADDALEFHDVDQALIVKGLVEHAQDPAFDKSDLNLTTDTPLTGIKRTRVYYWHDRQTISSCLAELTALAGGVDVTIEATPDKRTVRSHYPSAGQETTVTLSTLGMVDDYDLALDGESSATTVIVQTDGSGPDREEGVATGADLLDGLVLEDVWTADPGTHVGELDEQARQACAWLSGDVELLTLTCDADHTDELIDRVGLGDRVGVDVRSPLKTVYGRRRITGWSLEPGSDRLTYAPTMEA